MKNGSSILAHHVELLTRNGELPTKVVPLINQSVCLFQVEKEKPTGLTHSLKGE